MKNLKKAFLAFLVLLFSLAPIGPENFLAFSEFSSQNGRFFFSGTERVSGTIRVENELVVAKDAVLIVEKGSEIIFDSFAQISVKGTLFLNGTSESPLKLKKSGGYQGYSISALEGGKIFARNIEMSGAGIALSYLERPKSFFKKAFANSYQGGFSVDGGELDVQSAKFFDSNLAVAINKGDPEKTRINRSSFYRNKNDAYSLVAGVDFRHNWWGQPAGPKKFCSNGNCYYEKMSGVENVSPWREEETFLDPVILIPGILGSQKKDGRWHMDLILKTYENLYNSMVSAGYVPEETLFEFPYEWRDSNAKNSPKLKEKIQEVKEKNNWPKVDLVAHSMGGLLARSYVQGSEYENDVDQLITLGTPQKGAPEAYLKWEGDAWFLTPSDIYASRILKQEAEEAGYADLFDYIHQRPIDSLRELLPVYDYLQDVEDNYQYKKYPFGYPKNPFLEDLNRESLLGGLNRVEFSKIVGKAGSEESTIIGYKVVDLDLGKYWQYGYPYLWDTLYFREKGIISGEGDFTVPIFSAQGEGVPHDNYFEIDSPHRNLPTEAQKKVLKILTGKEPEKETRRSPIESLLIFSVYSPVDIQVVEKETGKRVGKDFETGKTFQEIEDSFYSGFQESCGDKTCPIENEFLTIPNPREGEYEVIFEGTGSGDFRIEAEKISFSESEYFEAPEKQMIVVSGRAEEGETRQFPVFLKGGKVFAEEKKAPTVESLLEDVERYWNQGLILKKGTFESLRQRIENIGRLQDLRLAVRNSFLPEKARKALLRALDFSLEKQIDLLTAEIGRSKNILDPAKSELIENLNLLKEDFLSEST